MSLFKSEYTTEETIFALVTLDGNFKAIRKLVISLLLQVDVKD